MISLSFDQFNSSPLVCVIFFVTLVFHFLAVSMISIDTSYNYNICIDDYNGHNYICHCRGSIISPVIDVKYVFAMMILVITHQPVLMCMISSIIFANSYLKYMTNTHKNRYVFNKNVSLALFLCAWISIYYCTIPDTFVPYLMLLASGCVVGI